MQPEDFKEIMCKGNFSDNTHSVVLGELVFDVTNPEDTLFLPKYLTINGHINCRNQPNLHKLPDILIVNIYRDGILIINFIKCLGLKDISNTNIIFNAFGGSVHFDNCENMTNAPSSIYLNGGLAHFTNCPCLIDIPKLQAVKPQCQIYVPKKIKITQQEMADAAGGNIT